MVNEQAVHDCWGACVVAGCVCGCQGACLFARGACMVARGHAWLQGACVVVGGGVHGWGACIGYDKIQSMSGWYASYWNAFLLCLKMSSEHQQK